MKEPMEHSAFPSDETLAAFIDGRLDEETRKRVVAHVADCEDCYGTVMAARAVGGTAELESDGTSSSRLVLISSAAAAAIIVVAILSVVRLRSPRSVPDDPLRPLVVAANQLPYRAIEARTTGGFIYKPLPVFRGRSGRQVLDVHWKLASAASAIDAQANEQRNAANTHALGMAHLLTGDTDEAIRVLNDALALTPRDAPERADVLTDLSAAYAARAVTSRPDALRSLDCAERAWEVRKTPETAWNRALALERLGLRKEALKAWATYLMVDPHSKWSTEARRHAEVLRAALGASWIFVKPRMVAALRQGDEAPLLQFTARFPQEVREYVVEEALPALYADDGLSNKEQTVTRLRAIADVFSRSGDRSLTEVLSEYAVRGRGDIGHRWSMYGEGRRLYQNGDVDSAEVAFRGAAGSEDGPLSALAIIGTASCRFLRNDLKGADAAASRASAIISRSRTPAIAALGDWIKGLVVGAEEPGRAIPILERALATFHVLHERANEAAVASLIADALEGIGDSTRAWEFRLEALENADAFVDRRRIHPVYNEAAETALHEGCGYAAVLIQSALVDDARTLSNRVYLCDAMMWRANANVANGHVEEAKADRQEITSALTKVDVGERARLAADLALLDCTLTQYRCFDGIAAATKFYRGTHRLTRLVEALVRSGKAAATLGQSQLARDRFGEAVEEVERGRQRLSSPRDRRTFLAIRKAAYAALAGSEIDAHHYSAAFDIVERSKSRSLLDAMEQQTAIDTAAAPTPLAVVQTSLTAGDALIEFLVMDDRTITFIVTKTQLEVRSIAIGSASVFRMTDTVTHAASVGKSVVVPMWASSALAKVPASRLIIVPDEALYAFPFALVDQRPLVVSPSASLFVRRHSLPARPTILVVEQNPPSDGTLPAADAEVSAIASIDSERTAILRGSGVVRAQLLRAVERHDVIYFVGHTLAINGETEKEALETYADGGALHAADIWRMHLPRRPLVILNACGTDRGAVLHSEGTASVASAFVAAGASAVVATLWDVDDTDASSVLTAFYGNLRQRFGASAALALAQQRARKEGVPVQAWAAFRVLGETEGVSHEFVN